MGLPISSFVLHPVPTIALLILLDTAFGIIPVEIIIVYGITVDLLPIEIGIIGAVFTVLGALIDYAIGMSGVRLFHLSKEEMERGRNFFRRYGVWSFFAVRFIPFFPVKPISLLAGSIKYNAANFSFYTGLAAFFRFYLEALILDEFYEPQKEMLDVLVRRAISYATDPLNYLISIFFIALGVAIFYYFVMRNRPAKQ